MASMSLTAEDLISSLYLTTLSQVFQDFFKMGSCQPVGRKTHPTRNH